jgi:hypothetical protein
MNAEKYKKMKAEGGKTYLEFKKNRNEKNKLRYQIDEGFRESCQEKARLRYEEKKDDPDFKEKNRLNSKKQYKRNKNDPEHKKYISKYYYDHKEEIAKNQKERNKRKREMKENERRRKKP